MIEVWAGKLARTIKSANEQQTAHEAVLKYALTIVINFVIPVCASLLIGWITGQFLGTLLSLTAFTLLRAVSGGFHFKSANVCMIVTTCIISIPPHITIPGLWVPVFTSISFILAVLLAPANIRGYARMPEKYFPIMKVLSLLIIGSNYIWSSSLLAVVFFIQGILLLPLRREVKS
ncbi:accessory gene regulator ArgB-like protein [Paenibacillus sp. GCM10012303]|jgi:accessory gene regulator B|uniref:accessory gene regulator ArgB-like protein n=1 Tax=Paenibacillus sp. GCM10012303 TaxID=3317340 RepID=UPI00361C0175